MKRVGVLLLAIFRAMYCWMFFIVSFYMIHFVYATIRSALQTHINEGRSIWTGVNTAAYSIVFDITWWLFVRRKSAFKKWAIAANLICILLYLPVALVYWNWPSFWKAEINAWPVVFIGILGIIVFSLPYREWPSDHSEKFARSTYSQFGR